MSEFYVYQLRRADQEDPFYIGKGKGDRLNEHFKGYVEDNPLKKNIIAKARAEGVELLAEIIEDGLEESEAFALEMATIKKYGRRDNGSGCLCNMTDGGEGLSGFRFSEESRARMSQMRMGKPKPEGFGDRLSSSTKGIPRPWASEKNGPMSEENYAKIFTQEYRSKMSEIKKGSKHSIESKTKIAEAAKARGARDQATIDKIKATKALAPILTCPHCNLKSKGKANMLRYHFDNCKLNPDNLGTLHHQEAIQTPSS